MDFKKKPTEEEILACLRQGDIQFPPFDVVDPIIDVAQNDSNTNGRFDAMVTLRWKDRQFRFAVELKRLWTPKAIAEATNRIKSSALPPQVYPLVIVPFLSSEQLTKLEAEGVSGIDLCGNGIVVVPNELLVIRTGKPNRFQWEQLIRNVYRRTSSIVARIFLLVSEFNSVNEVLGQIRKRGGEVTLPTVSKVCTTLAEDLIIERSPRGKAAKLRKKNQTKSQSQRTQENASTSQRSLRLLQPEKLLDLLAENYTPPDIRRTFVGKCTLAPDELRRRLENWGNQSGARVVLTGATSVEAYAIMARESMQSIYCSDLDGAIDALGQDLRETDRFANVTLFETRDDNFVYFDRRADLCASPIQTYLELTQGDKREQQTAEQVRRAVLAPISPNVGEK